MKHIVRMVITVVLAVSMIACQIVSTRSAVNTKLKEEVVLRADQKVVPHAKAITKPNSAQKLKTTPKAKFTPEPNATAKSKTSTSAQPAADKQSGAAAKKTKKVIVVLDPGHDNERCTRNHPQLGVKEQALNLKIAKACYKQLKKYDGIKVYMTRKNGQCPNRDHKYKSPDTSRPNQDCILARTSFAEKKKADMYISMHCDASTGRLGASANGATVYVSRHPKFRKKSSKLGKLILKGITKVVNIRSNGIRTRSDSGKGRYKNGTTKDYYYLISNNIDNGRPGIIVEHAFMDNRHDNKILRNDRSLKKIGIADAKAIAKYYKLKKTDE